MTREGWRELVLDVVRDAEHGDPIGLDLLASLLEELDEAKQALRDAGYGCTGMGLRKTVAEVPRRE